MKTASFSTFNKPSNESVKFWLTFNVKILAILIFLAALCTLLPRFFTIVPAGYIGLSENFGKVSATNLEPGFHVISPFTKVIKLSTRVKNIEETFSATSKDGVNLDLKVSFQYQLDPSKAATAYKDVGIDEETIIIPRLHFAIRQIINEHKAQEIIKTTKQQRDNLKQELDKLNIEELGFKVDDVLLEEVRFPEEVQKYFLNLFQLQKTDKNSKTLRSCTNSETALK
jgi:regulator of protease activity HflC (stomatin/prohibitin superfamily)